MVKVKVKICGLFRRADIEYVNELRPEYIGFVFAKSRRQVTPQQAKKLRAGLHPDIIPVGVFVDETSENIAKIVRDGIISAVQLHGRETEEYIKTLKALVDVPVIKAVPVRKIGDVQERDGSRADCLLLDHITAGQGQSFDWDLIGESKKPYFLAGGLTPENVAHAVAKTTPYAVDVSSGVEENGVKNREKIEKFIKNSKK